MAEKVKNKHINIKNLASELRNLRDVNSSDEDYMKVLECLSYEKPTSISSAKFDAILIKTAKTKLRGIRAEFTMMALGLLLGYERDIDIGTRRLNYLKYSNYTLEFVKKDRGFYNEATPEQQEYYMKSLLKAEEYYVDKLAVFLKEKMESGKFDEFIKDLKDYYDPNTDTPILLEPEYIKKQKRISGLSKNFDAGDDLDTRLIHIKGKENESVNKITKAIYFAGLLIAGSIITGFIIVGIIKPIIIEKANADIATMSPVTPAVTISSIEDIPVAGEMLIEVESFTITDENKNVSVVPGISRKLDIELYPQDADISTLDFRSSSPDIVGAEYGYVTASENIVAGKSYVVDITIVARKTRYEDVVHVTVEKPVIPDNAEGMVGGGIQPDY